MVFLSVVPSYKWEGLVVKVQDDELKWQQKWIYDWTDPTQIFFSYLLHLQHTLTWFQIYVIYCTFCYLSF